ncbi:Hypothetical predicted protein [Paramuricea clavata]|uniref:Uncharacterized protein n=1 Tax=Paramuricea clavata TaxID=317549 RepID=A0A7D9ID13_PARCT|nr:Hypothetical predicted protein [Paramuricea clavata]
MKKTENVTFYGTLARTRQVFWVKEKSDSLNLSALEDDKPVPTKNTTANKPVTKNTTGKVTSITTPTKVTSITTPTKVTSITTPTSKGSNTTSFGVSLLSILLIITIKISTS